MTYPRQPLIADAVRDIRSRTLAGIDNDFGRLICIASTRDYNTGRYYHDGLASSFSAEVAEIALATCHLEIFQQLAVSTLRSLVLQMETYVGSTGSDSRVVAETWQKLEPYRVTIPVGCDPLSAELFFSNIRVALAILRSREVRDSEDPRSSSPPPSPSQ